MLLNSKTLNLPPGKLPANDHPILTPYIPLAKLCLLKLHIFLYIYLVIFSIDNFSVFYFASRDTIEKLSKSKRDEKLLTFFASTREISRQHKVSAN